MRHRHLASVAVAGAAVVLLAACGGGGNGGSGSSASGYSSGSGSTSSTTTTAAGGATSATGAAIRAGDTRLGKVLVDAQGRTLYLFTRDSGTQTACTGSCTSLWPAVTAASGTPAVGSDLDASKVSVVRQSDGTMQVAYGGHLLYRYAADNAAGDVNGQGVGGIWFAVTPSGERASG